MAGSLRSLDRTLSERISSIGGSRADTLFAHCPGAVLKTHRSNCFTYFFLAPAPDWNSTIGTGTGWTVGVVTFDSSPTLRTLRIDQSLGGTSVQGIKASLGASKNK